MILERRKKRRFANDLDERCCDRNLNTKLNIKNSKEFLPTKYSFHKKMNFHLYKKMKTNILYFHHFHYSHYHIIMYNYIILIYVLYIYIYIYIYIHTYTHKKIKSPLISIGLSLIGIN